VGRKKNELAPVKARELRHDGSSVHPGQISLSRPRLGAPDDTWSTVLKDVVREAPKTALVTAGTLALTLLSLIVYLITVFAGYGGTPPPPIPLAHQLLQVALEAVWHTISN
jgi:hypothetical protein